MKLGTFIAGTAGIVVLGVLGFRIIDLEQRVALLVEQSGVGQSTGVSTASAAPREGASVPKTMEQRLSSLERQVEALTKQLNQSHRPTSTDLKSGIFPQEEAILSVVERENSRIRDVQLEWHRARWQETRDQQLAAFATSQHLQPEQTMALRSALEHELDDMVMALKRPGWAEDPDQAASDWQAVLQKTDQSALAVLSPEQQQVWLQVRQFERAVLFPWLPKGNP